MVPVSKVDSAITIEFSADDYTADTYVLLLDFEKVPTYRSFEFAQNIDIGGGNASLDGVFAWKTDQRKLVDRPLFIRYICLYPPSPGFITDIECTYLMLCSIV